MNSLMRKNYVRWLTVTGVLLITAAVVCLVVFAHRYRTLTAHFQNAVGLYSGDDVRLLGVPIGTVTTVTPEQNSVRVELRYRADVPLPPDVRAVIVAPTLVTGRFVQLTPLYRSGPRLVDRADVPLERTEVPLEWDQIKKQLSTLTRALGPDGAGHGGALNQLLQTTARNLDGQGENLHQTIAQLAGAATTLSDGRTDLSGTVRNLQVFVSALARSDEQVDHFNSKLADVSRVLADNRQQLSAAMSTLDATLPVVQHFVADNRGRLSSAVSTLGSITSTLSRNRQALADLLQITPTAASNFHNAYDPFSGSLTSQVALTNLHDPGTFLCSAIFSVGGTPEQCQAALNPLAQLLRVDNSPVSASPVERNGASNQTGPDGSAPPSSEPEPRADLHKLLLPWG
jgi:phospholipid/cholesterol/gamma-HCH transport system substrate-binding protein